MENLEFLYIVELKIMQCCGKQFFKRFHLILEKERGKENDRERNINVWLPLMCPPTGDLARNPGMCPDWESNQWTLWFTGQHSIHWATPARADRFFWKDLYGRKRSFSYCMFLGPSWETYPDECELETVKAGPRLKWCCQRNLRWPSAQRPCVCV